MKRLKNVSNVQKHHVNVAMEPVFTTKPISLSNVTVTPTPPFPTMENAFPIIRKLHQKLPHQQLPHPILLQLNLYQLQVLQLRRKFFHCHHNQVNVGIMEQGAGQNLGIVVNDGTRMLYTIQRKLLKMAGYIRVILAK